MARKKGTQPQIKAENVNVRLDPRTRFGLELLARVQRRNLSSVVEWAINKAIHCPQDGLIEREENGEAYNFLYDLWDVEEWDRLHKMATLREDLLTFEEERLIKLILGSEIYLYLDKKVREEYPPNMHDRNMYERKLCESLREYYPIFKKVDAGELSKDHLPKIPSEPLLSLPK